jgi:hypothetical protein
MTTTTTALPCCVLIEPQMGWDRADWLEAFTEGPHDIFPASVIAASDGRGHLDTDDLARLLQMHGATVDQLRDDLAEGRDRGAPVQPLEHAGQALAWLGY